MCVCVCVILPQTNSFSEILVEDQYITAMGRRVLTKEGNAHFRNNKACPEFIYLSVNKGTESTKKNSLSCSLSGESQDDLCVGKRFKSYTLSRVG